MHNILKLISEYKIEDAKKSFHEYLIQRVKSAKFKNDFTPNLTVISLYDIIGKFIENEAIEFENDREIYKKYEKFYEEHVGKIDGEYTYIPDHIKSMNFLAKLDIKLNDKFNKLISQIKEFDLWSDEVEILIGFLLDEFKEFNIDRVGVLEDTQVLMSEIEMAVVVNAPHKPNKISLEILKQTVEAKSRRIPADWGFIHTNSSNDAELEEIRRLAGLKMLNEPVKLGISCKASDEDDLATMRKLAGYPKKRLVDIDPDDGNDDGNELKAGWRTHVIAPTKAMVNKEDYTEDFKKNKQQELLDDALVVYHLKTPERKVFGVDVGNLSFEKAKEHIDNIKNEIHQRKIPSKLGMFKQYLGWTEKEIDENLKEWEKECEKTKQTFVGTPIKFETNLASTAFVRTPDIENGVIYKGTIDITKEPPQEPQKGSMYRVTNGGTPNQGFNTGEICYRMDTGDYVVYNGSSWDRITNDPILPSGSGISVTPCSPSPTIVGGNGINVTKSGDVYQISLADIPRASAVSSITVDAKGRVASVSNSLPETKDLSPYCEMLNRWMKELTKERQEKIGQMLDENNNVINIKQTLPPLNNDDEDEEHIDPVIQSMVRRRIIMKEE